MDQDLRHGTNRSSFDRDLLFRGCRCLSWLLLQTRASDKGSWSGQKVGKSRSALQVCRKTSSLCLLLLRLIESGSEVALTSSSSEESHPQRLRYSLVIGRSWNAQHIEALIHGVPPQRHFGHKFFEFARRRVVCLAGIHVVHGVFNGLDRFFPCCYILLHFLHL